MPTYEYACRECNHRFEKWQKMSDEPLTTCPVCGGPIHRVFYPAGIVFKGSGFYKTDHPGVAAAASAAGTAGPDGANANGHTEHTATTEKSETKSSGESKSAASTAAATESKAS